MRPFQDLFFDLDGTLTDPAQGITAACTYALQKLGYPLLSYEELCTFIGPPLKGCFESHCGMSPEQADHAVETYREYYRDRGLFENQEIPGVRQALAELRGRGYRLCVATSKPEVFAVRILEKFELASFFEVIAGSDLAGARVEKAAVIEDLIARTGADRTRSLMIGDTKYDILGARQAGIAGAGVAFGYGTRAELREAGALWIAETPEEILKNLE